MKALTLLLSCATGLLCFAPAPSLAAPFGSAFVSFDDDEDESDDDADDQADEEDADQWLALVGGDIVTGTGEMLRGATLLAKNGVIEEIGYDFHVPEEAEVHDLRGLRLYPGMIALSATSRITQGLLAPEDPDMFVDPQLAELDAAEFGGGIDDWADDWADDAEDAEDEGATDEPKVFDDYDPFSPFMTLALAAGITTVEQSGTAIKLRRFEIEDVVVAEDNLTSVSFSTADSRRRAREDFASASAYLRDMRAWEAAGDKEAKEPSKKGVNMSLVKVLTGETRAKFNSSDRDQLLAIARLAQKYHFRPVINGAREGWIVADELGRAGATIVLTPRDRNWKSDELQVAEGGSSIENAAILHRAGCQIAVEPSSGSIDLGGIAGRDLIHLMIEAAFAVRGGLPEQAALESVTIIPARVLGCDHRLGTLEVGKDADVIVTDGDLLHYETFVQYAFVSGALAYDKQEELFYAHIRPRAEREVEAEESADESAESGEVEVESDEDSEGEDSGDEDSDDESEEDEAQAGDDESDDEESSDD